MRPDGGSAAGDRVHQRPLVERRGLPLKGNATIEVIGPAIAEALYATAGGLLIAIFAAIGFNYCTTRVEELTVDMNDVSSEFVDHILREGRH